MEMADRAHAWFVDEPFGVSAPLDLAPDDFEAGPPAPIDNPSWRLARDSLALISARAVVAGDAYPIRTDSDVVVRRDADRELVYRFLLLRDVWHLVASGAPPQHESFALLQEHVAAEALRGFLHGEAVRFGTPREAPLGATFQESLKWLARQLGTRVNTGGDDYDPAGDGGVDAIGWSQFGDGRPNTLVVLAQAASGRDWRAKGVDLERWEQQLLFFPVPPLRALFFTGTLDTIEDRDLRTLGLGLVFDRLRTCRLARSERLSADIRTRMEQWVDMATDALRGDQ